jgi:hypothetical protein
MDTFFIFGLFLSVFMLVSGVFAYGHHFCYHFYVFSYSSLAFHGNEDTPSFWGFVCMTDDLMSRFDVLNLSVDMICG